MEKKLVEAFNLVSDAVQMAQLNYKTHLAIQEALKLIATKLTEVSTNIAQGE